MGPNAISETILIVIPHLQTGNVIYQQSYYPLHASSNIYHSDVVDLCSSVSPCCILVLTTALCLLVLPRLQDRQAASVGLVLSALQKQLSRLPVPYCFQQEEADEYGLCRCCAALAAFIKPFTEEVMIMMMSGNSAHEEMKTELRNL